MKRRIVLALAALAVVLLTAAPASAEEYLGIGTDGTSFSTDLTDPLFDSGAWVPGDTRSATFYVRNQGGTSGRLTVDLVGGQAGALLDSGMLRITATGDGGRSVWASDTRDHRLLTVPTVPVRGIVPVTVTAVFDQDAPRSTQLLSTDLRFTVSLRQNTAEAELGTEGPQETQKTQVTHETLGILPNTGASALSWVIALAAICLGTGFGLLSRRSTHEEGASHG